MLAAREAAGSSAVASPSAIDSQGRLPPRGFSAAQPAVATPGIPNFSSPFGPPLANAKPANTFARSLVPSAALGTAGPLNPGPIRPNGSLSMDRPGLAPAQPARLNAASAAAVDPNLVRLARARPAGQAPQMPQTGRDAAPVPQDGQVQIAMDPATAIAAAMVAGRLALQAGRAIRTYYRARKGLGRGPAIGRAETDQSVDTARIEQPAGAAEETHRVAVGRLARKIGETARVRFVQSGKAKVRLRLHELGDNVDRNDAIQAFVEASLDGRLGKPGETVAELNLGLVQPEAATRIKIKTGVNVGPLEYAVDDDAIRHINREHGLGNEDQVDQIPVSSDALAFAIDLIEDPKSSIEHGSKKGGAPTILFERTLNDRYSVVVQVRRKQGTLSLHTMYIKAK